MRTMLAIAAILFSAPGAQGDEPPAAAKLSANDLGHIHYPVRKPGTGIAPPGRIVLVEAFPASPAQQPYQGLLQREIFRQALLMAAREELGLATRDRTLRDPFPADEEPRPASFGVVSNGRQARVMGVTLYREAEKGAEALWFGEQPTEVHVWMEQMVTMAERLSRNEFVDLLKKAGYEPQPRKAPHPATARVSEAVEALLLDFNFLAQYEAVRRLHGEIAENGESLPVLGALSRAYAHLGAVTNYLVSPVHKALEARALLYAERLVAHHPDAPEAYWARAYVRTFVGLHAAALEDLKHADEISERRAAPTGSAKPPPWVAAIDASCRFDRTRQETLAEDAKIRPLVRFLQLLANDGARSVRTRLQSAGAVLEDCPDCWKAVNLVSSHAALGIQRTAVAQAAYGFPESVYRRLAGIPGLPEDAAKICGKERRKTAGDDEEDEESMDLADEAASRAALLRVLRLADQSASDAGEPSLGLLAHLIEETGFLQVWAAVFLEQRTLGVPADATLEMLKPIYAGHRFKDLMDVFSSDLTAARDARARLWQNVQAWEAELEYTSLSLVRAGWTKEREPTGALLRIVPLRIDPVFRDLAAIEQFAGSGEQRVREAQRLLHVSPHSPLSIATQITQNWPAAEKSAAEWEKTYSEEPIVLTALSNRYWQLARWEDAERCLKAEVKAGPEFQTYERLANLYQKQGKRDAWRATLEEFLNQEEEVGLEHSRMRVQIADDYMKHREYDKALPYAVAAAESYSAWGLQCAQRCYDGLEDWEKAEAYARAAAERYESESLDWLKWCRWRDRGDVDAARELTARWIGSLGDPPPAGRMNDVAAFQLLSGENDKALETFQQAFAKTKEAYQGLFAALGADDSGNAELRDRLFKEVVEGGVQARARGRTRAGLVALAGLLADSLAADPPSKFDFDGFNKLLREAPARRGEATNLYYFAGRFLLKHGQPDKGLEFLKQAATSPVSNFSRVLATILLRQEKADIGPLRDSE